jgi:hypothetical protein
MSFEEMILVGQVRKLIDISIISWLIRKKKLDLTYLFILIYKIKTNSQYSRVLLRFFILEEQFTFLMNMRRQILDSPK